MSYVGLVHFQGQGCARSEIQNCKTSSEMLFTGSCTSRAEERGVRLRNLSPESARAFKMHLTPRFHVFKNHARPENFCFVRGESDQMLDERLRTAQNTTKELYVKDMLFKKKK